MNGDRKAGAADANHRNSDGSGQPSWGTVIELGAGDEVASLRPKLEAAKGPVVALVVPKGVESLRQTLSLRLLRRYAEGTGKEAVLVTSDWVTREAAQSEGFRVYSPNEFEERRAPEVAASVATEESEVLRKSGLRWRVILAGIIVAVVVGLAALAYLFLPSATVVITPASQIVSDTLEATAAIDRQDIDLASGQIPAQRVQTSFGISEWISTTGKHVVPDQRAVGEVAFINLTSETVTVPMGSRVGTDEGIWFATDAEAEVPPTGSVGQARVGVTALQPGSAGNVPPLAIQRFEDGQLRFSLRLLNESPTHGGSNRDVGHVTEQDRERLREKATEGARQASREELQRQLGPSYAFYPETMEVSLNDERFDRAVGTDADELNLEATATVSALAFRQADLDALAGALFEGRGQVHVMEGTIRSKLLEAQTWSQDEVSFQFFAQSRVTPIFDHEQIKQALVGMSAEQARDYLRQNLPQADAIEVAVTPGWIDSLPRLPWRIDIEILGVR